MREFLSSYWTLEILAQLVIPIYLLCRRLPRRPTTTLRLALVMVCLLCLAVVPLATGLVTGLDTMQAFLVFSGLLAVFVGLIVFIYDASPWQALFCATSGYTIQNFSSGVTILAQYLINGRPGDVLVEPLDLIVSLGVPALAYTITYFGFVRRIDKNGLIVVENKLMLFMFAITICMIIGLDVVIKGVAMFGTVFSYLVLLRLLHAAICVFVLFAEYEILYAKRMSEEKAETERLLAERDRQYRLSRANIEAINIKCHDIRHQIRHLSDGEQNVDRKALVDIAREVNIYDSVVETGNEALDTILTEKSLACSSEGIVLSVIADGGALDFMTPSDIYSLFGNALDNSIEAVRAMDDPERRTITLTVRRRGSMAAINLENWYAHRPLFRDGLPITSKEDQVNHGFGMRSMRGIVRRYGGTLHVGAEKGIFYLNALLAAQEAK